MGTILRHIQPSVDFAKVIDRHYVRLVEPGSVLGLPAEPFLKDPVIHEVRGAPASAPPPGRWRCFISLIITAFLKPVSSSAPPRVTSGAPRPGWYQDGQRGLRWWNGSEWTDAAPPHRRRE